MGSDNLSADSHTGPYSSGPSAPAKASAQDLFALKSIIEQVQVKVGLIDPYSQTYPLIEARELQPPFDPAILEYKELPGFSMVAFDRPLEYQDESFQYDLLHDPEGSSSLETIMQRNLNLFLSKLPRTRHEELIRRLEALDVTSLEQYEDTLEFICGMDRGHVIARSGSGNYRLLGIYASFPSDLDNQIKRFGLKIGKFRAGDSKLYERNRFFVYRYLMELYGFPISSERRTSAAMFARKLAKNNENFIVSVLGNSDRVLTFLSSRGKKHWPLVEKIALVSLDEDAKDIVDELDEAGYFVDRERKVIIFKATYIQHEYNPDNLIEDRALSVVEQEAIHPVTGDRFSNLNLLKTTQRRLVRLNDIVRGEHQGQIVYGDHEVIYGTEDHLSRLKFLNAWLVKHRRTLLGYSPRTFRQIERTLHSYLKDPDLIPELLRYPVVYRTACMFVDTLRQEFQLVQLENALEKKDGKRRSLSYRDRLALLLEFLYRERELINYQEEVFEKVMFLCDRVLDGDYFKKRYRTRQRKTESAYEKDVLELYDQVMRQRNRLELRYFRSSYSTSAV
ncbi:MAG: hypothetical protein HY788_03750 [Deltaproteobacteria bacterium]|nr:hypothetical protein [Deltaproteobacteria bacterium]